MDQNSKRKKSFYSNFISDRHYLLKYYLMNLCILGAGCIAIQMTFNRMQDFNYLWLWLAGLILFVLPNFSLIFFSGLFYLGLYFFSNGNDFAVKDLLWIPVGAIVGAVSAAMIHNASHLNFRPKWINRFVGELNGLLQLSGFVGWTISHTIHHASSDDPAYDAHPPGTLTFRGYQNVMGTQMKNNMTNKYFEVFGKTTESEKNWNKVVLLLPCVRYVRVFFLLMAFGPTIFTFFFVPIKIANALVFSDFNYRTHRPNQNGDVEVLNLNNTLLIKFLNSITWGSYYHKNHHRRPTVLDPRNVTIGADEPLITYKVSMKV